MNKVITDMLFTRYGTLLIISAMLLGCASSKPSAGDSTAKEEVPGIHQESVLKRIQYDSTATAVDTAVSALSADTDVEQLLQDMTLREKIGQLFFVPAYGYYKSADDESYQELLTQIKDYHVGGLIFFSGNVYGQAVLTNKLQEVSHIPLWITQDMEYGAAMRVNGSTRFTPAMGVAATKNPDYAYWIGKVTAREAKALGVHQIFAPVLDVNNNPDNPVINVRSFSGNPQTVARFGNRFIEGVKAEGLVSTAKHFPGHGDTDTDSHLSLPSISYNFARLDSIELVPFRSAIKGGLQSIMSAHIAFPKITKFPDVPATLDPSILNRILIDSLRFDGMVVTDGLEMNGIASNFSPGDAVVRSLQAGADLMLLSPDLRTAINEVEHAVHKGRITEERIEQSVRKLLRWKKAHGLFQKPKVDVPNLSSAINTRENELLADEISRRSLTLLKNEGDILPIRASSYPKVTVITIADDESGSTGSFFASKIREYHPDVAFHVLDKRTGLEEKEQIMKDARNSDLLILGSFIYVRSGQEVQMSSSQLNFLKLLPDKPKVLVAFGNPYVVQDLSDTQVQLMAWAANSGQVRSVVPALFGGSEISGRMPIEIPGMHSFNHGLDIPQTAIRYDEPETVALNRDSLNRIDRVMNRAVFDSTFPGGVVTVLKDGVIAYQKGYGYHTYDKLKKTQASDIFDLASLTKVVATTSSVMKLVDEGKLKLSHRVGKYIPEFRVGEKKQITIRHLLLHESGLPAFRVYIDSLQTEKEILKAIKNEPLINPPGKKYVYSDLGYILLGEIIEQITGTSLDAYVRKTFYYPLGMNATFFNPQKVGNWISSRVPPTEIDTLYRDKTILGEVHDERAWYLNGVAGHAGLFSNGRDLAVFAQMLMNEGTYAGRNYLDPGIIEQFISKQSSISNRGYGFDHKSEVGSSAGSLTSAKTYGHTGFTGTSMWIDPERNTAVIILTNRTYPYRSYGKKISTIRAAVADIVMSSIME